MTLKQKALLRWSSGFFLSNILVFWFLGLRYLFFIPWHHTEPVLFTLFVVLSYCGHFALLALLPLTIVFPVALVVHQRAWVIALSVSLATCSASLFIADAVIYGLYHFHLNGVFLALLLNGNAEQFFSFSKMEYASAGFIFLGVLLLECLLGWCLKQSGDCEGASPPLQIPQRSLTAAALLFFCLYTSYLMLISSAGTVRGESFIETARVFPLYTEIVGVLLPASQGREKLENAFELKFADDSTASLHYPLEPLKFARVKHPLNIVLIVIDTWRFDMLKPEVMPRVFQFSQKAWTFKEHFSGGNATAPGIFSLFYGLPATYWSGMERKARGPVLMSALLQQHYQLNILASAGLSVPAFDRTVFREVKMFEKDLPGKGPYERDLAVTQKFQAFISEPSRAQKPFFSFLFYNSAHSYCALTNNLQPFQPVSRSCNRLELGEQTDALPYLNRYKNALGLVDQQVATVLQTLQARHLLANTVVIITGDHGEEFNDTGLGFWGHGSNFSRFQLQTPLIVYWPGEKPRRFSQVTTHFEVAPFLLQKLLGCKTAPQAYSTGSSLLEEAAFPQLVASYVNFGVLEKERATTVFPSGHFQVTSLDGQPLPLATLKPSVLQKVFQDGKRFFEPGDHPN